MRKLTLSGGEEMAIQELTRLESSAGESLETERSSCVFAGFDSMAVNVETSLGRRERREMGRRIDVSVTKGLLGFVDLIRV